MLNKQYEIPRSSQDALPGRDCPIRVPDAHYVNGAALEGPFADHLSIIYVGMGCFWGAERLFWQQSGVAVTAVGYAGGYTPNPLYAEVCSGQTGHAEVVMVVYDPVQLPLTQLLALFWEQHDPTQGMRQGNDVGTQYRSCIYTTDAEQMRVVASSLQNYQQQLRASGLGEITTELRENVSFYYAEVDHQQYLAKNPGGYCGLRGTGIRCVGE